MRTRTHRAAPSAPSAPAAAAIVDHAPVTAVSTAPASRDAHGHDPADYDWVPVRRRPRADGLTPEVQRAFIGYLADTGSVRQAAQTAGVSPSALYRLRRAPDGAAFAAAWDAAIQQAAHALVDAAFERAVHGSEEPVWDREGNVIGRRFRQSDAMMMFLLRKHFPDRYGDIHRDRPSPSIAATAPPAPPVADTLARIGPERPADPAALLDPDYAELLYLRADNAAARAATRAVATPPEDLGAVFEDALEEAKADTADGREWLAAQARADLDGVTECELPRRRRR